MDKKAEEIDKNYDLVLIDGTYRKLFRHLNHVKHTFLHYTDENGKKTSVRVFRSTILKTKDRF